MPTKIDDATIEKWHSSIASILGGSYSEILNTIGEIGRTGSSVAQP
jgi:hypothetical protein